MTIGIKTASFYLPNQSVDITDLPEYSLLSGTQADFFKNVGIKTIRIEEDKSAIEMAIASASDVLIKSELTGNQIDAIILLRSRSPKHLMSSEVTYLQHSINAENAFCLTQTGLGCVDISGALIIAKKLLSNDSAYNNILIAYGSTPYTQNRFRYPITITGDGAFAMIVSRTDTPQIIGQNLESNGEYWDLFTINYKKSPWGQWEERCRDLHKYSFQLAIESKTRFEKMNNKLVQACGLSLLDVDHFIMQNISTTAYKFYEECFNIKFNKICSENLKQFGHLGPMDIIINLLTVTENQKLTNGQTVMLMNNSPVAAWSSMLIKI